MNYTELKNLEMPTLFALVRRTLDAQFDLTPNQFIQGSPLPVPTLFLIGDFEIRARFQNENAKSFDSLFDKFQADVTEFSIEANKLATVELDKYGELLGAVACEIPGESRHQSALRCIRDRFQDPPPPAALPDPIPSNPEDLQYIYALGVECERLKKALAEANRSHYGPGTSEAPRQLGGDSNQGNLESLRYIDARWVKCERLELMLAAQKLLELSRR